MAGCEARAGADPSSGLGSWDHREVRSLIARRSSLSNPPLIGHRVVRDLLKDESALGVQIVTGKHAASQTENDGLFQLALLCNTATILLTFQRALCVEEGLLLLDWFEAISGTSVRKLLLGKWSPTGTNDMQQQDVPFEATMDWWEELLMPLLLQRHGCSCMPSLSPWRRRNISLQMSSGYSYEA